MSDIEEVLGRLRADHRFREEVERDPRAALTGYQLTADDLRLLAARVEDDEHHLAPRRTSRSALLALLARGDPDPDDSMTEDQT